MWGAVGAATAVVGAVLAVITLYRSVRADARKRADTDRREREKLRNDAFADGVRSMATSIAMAEFQRDETRRELADRNGELRDATKRIADLEAELRQAARHGEERQ